MRFFFLNGKFVKEKDAKIEVNDLGLLRGYGVFDYLRTYDRILFHFDDHIFRFFNSAKKMNLKVPYSKEEIKKIFYQLIKKNKNLSEFSFRIVLTGGRSSDGKTSKDQTFFIIVDKSHIYPKLSYKKGIKLITINYLREFSEIKSLNYAMAISNWEKILKKGAQEILYISDRNIVSECSTSNFFIVKKKILYSPRTNVLNGITKKVVVSLAKKSRFKIIEKDLFLKEALSSDESFITSTDKEILPVVKIDNFKIGNGKVGEVTTELMKVFNEYIVKYVDKNK